MIYLLIAFFNITFLEIDFFRFGGWGWGDGFRGICPIIYTEKSRVVLS